MKLWHPMLPLYGRGNAWAQLDARERSAVSNEYPDWTVRELQAVRWERIPLPSGVTVRATKDLDFDGVRVPSGSLGCVVRHGNPGAVRIAWFDSECAGGVWARVEDIEPADRPMSHGKGRIPMKQAAVSYIERADGRLLCVWNKRYGGWTLPGGRVEDGETPEEAQRRELLEETGLGTLEAERFFSLQLVPKPPHEDRAAEVLVFRVAPEGMAEDPKPMEMELGCPVTWLTREEFLSWCPFAELYRPIFARMSESA